MQVRKWKKEEAGGECYFHRLWVWVETKEEVYWWKRKKCICLLFFRVLSQHSEWEEEEELFPPNFLPSSQLATRLILPFSRCIILFLSVSPILSPLPLVLPPYSSSSILLQMCNISRLRVQKEEQEQWEGGGGWSMGKNGKARREKKREEEFEAADGWTLFGRKGAKNRRFITRCNFFRLWNTLLQIRPLITRKRWSARQNNRIVGSEEGEKRERERRQRNMMEEDKLSCSKARC